MMGKGEQSRDSSDWLLRYDCFNLDCLRYVSVLGFLGRPIVSRGLNVQDVLFTLQKAHAPEPVETQRILQV